MGHADDSIPPAQPGSPALEQRYCPYCKETKVVSPETWPYRNERAGGHYRPHGQRCLACEKKRKSEYEARRDKIANLVKDEPPPKDAKASKAVAEQAKLDAAKSLKLGSRVLNEASPGVLARVLRWAEDESAEEHRWAVQFLAERILPRKLYEELGGQAAGGAVKERPQFVVQVIAAQPEGRVIEGQHEVVRLLPAEPEQS